MKYHIARQPIFNRKMQVFGYELLYRRIDTENFYATGFVSDDEASSSVILNSFFNYGIKEMTGGRPAFINFTSNLLTNQIATLFPSDALIIEILETVEETPEILDRCRELKAMGYRLALDDFVLTEKNIHLAELADIIKIDFTLSSIDEIQSTISRLRRDNLTFLGEKIETQEMFKQAMQMRFNFFQGYFFAKPLIVSGESLRPLAVNYLRLIQMVNKPEFSFRSVTHIIMQDVFLSFQLLKLVNSVAFGFQTRIKTIHHALVALGSSEVRKWVSLISMMGVCSGPKELHKISLGRAKFCEMLAPIVGYKGDPSALFFTGLFSTMDVITNRPFDVICSEIAVSDETYDALVHKKGSHYPFLALSMNYEQGEWGKVNVFADELGISTSDLGNMYLQAIAWCDSILDGEAA